VRIESSRYHKATGKQENETRYSISSLKADAKQINQTIRLHWGIENKLHWILDVAFGRIKAENELATRHRTFLSSTALP
jgi:predicted transposase YbfD/YdcC